MVRLAIVVGLVVIPTTAGAQFVTLSVDQITTANNTDGEDRDEVYFLLLGGSSTGTPVYGRTPHSGAHVETTFGGQDYFGLAPAADCFKAWRDGGTELSGFYYPCAPGEPSSARKLPIATVHVPPEGYFLGCLLIAEQDNGEAAVLSSLLLGLLGKVGEGAAGALGGGLVKLIFPDSTQVPDPSKDQHMKRLKALQHISQEDFARQVFLFNANCATYAAQVREDNHQVIGSVTFAAGFTSDGELATYWDAPQATQTILLSSSYTQTTAIATGHRAVYGVTLHMEATKLVTFRFQHSSKCLDVPAASQDSVTVQQFTCQAGLNQQWQLQTVFLDQTAVGSRMLDFAFAGFALRPVLAYVLRAAHSGKCLEAVDANVLRERHEVRQFDCRPSMGQLWVPEPQDFVPGAETQPRRLRNFLAWHQCLDVAGNSLSDGGSVGIFACKPFTEATKGNQLIRIESP